MLKLTKRQILESWQEFRDNIRNSTPVDKEETLDQKKRRIAKLEANPEEWFKYYFPNDFTAPPAPFQVAATKRVLANPEWYEVRMWSRELAKSTRSMGEDLYLLLTGKKFYKLLCSATEKSAVDLFMPYMVHLETNQRIINDYGEQEKIGSWKIGMITTRSGFSIKAVGGGIIRGTKTKGRRPDIIDFDDYDTDDRARNEELVTQDWDFATKAVIGTRSISVPTLIKWNGNFIAENCCIAQAAKFADKHEIINIRDKDGKSTWPAKNTEEHIDRVLSKIPWSAQQSEYFNNPFTVGRIFKNIQWGDVPPLHRFPFLVAYADPATSNKDKDKGMGKNSFKSLVLVGCLEHRYYVIHAFLDQCTNAKFADWFFVMQKLIDAKCARYRSKPVVFYYIENNTLQEPFYDQVFKPLFFAKSQEHRLMLSIIPDGRKKPEKLVRIEGTLEPLNTNGLLIFNKEEENNQHMVRLVDQMKSVGPNAKIMDGPDALEGAVSAINSRAAYNGGVNLFARPTNPRRF